MKKIIFSAAILLAGFSAANAQSTQSATQTVTINVVNAISISLSASTSAFNFSNTTDFENGLTNMSASTVTVKSNRPWNTTVASATANFGGPALTVMPSTVLGVRLSTDVPFKLLNTTAASLIGGGKGSSSFIVDYNAKPGFVYDAGAYTLGVIYTATQQ